MIWASSFMPFHRRFCSNRVRYCIKHHFLSRCCWFVARSLTDFDIGICIPANMSAVTPKAAFITNFPTLGVEQEMMLLIILPDQQLHILFASPIYSRKKILLSGDIQCTHHSSVTLQYSNRIRRPALSIKYFSIVEKTFLDKSE